MAWASVSVAGAFGLAGAPDTGKGATDAVVLGTSLRSLMESRLRMASWGEGLAIGGRNTRLAGPSTSRLS
ncbi:hypothetical protein GCM10012319_66190 [Comamonas sp. KCTC 72670]|nr:hypothetical protein GCM10012319_66190 [Comamonas sp. KCTC 72670]